MELQEFIQSSLIEISNGVKHAKQVTGLKFMLGGIPNNTNDHNARIEFDIAVQVQDKTVSGKSGGLEIKVVKADLTKSTENTLASTSRLKFIVEKPKNYISHEEI
jgi:hypothetical protein